MTHIASVRTVSVGMALHTSGPKMVVGARLGISKKKLSKNINKHL